jgi:orotidine-5'-phosphate decarboxylase
MYWLVSFVGVLRFPESQYNTPETVILDNNCDVIIVGRGIYKTDDPVAAAKAYQQAGWAAYQARLGAR